MGGAQKAVTAAKAAVSKKQSAQRIEELKLSSLQKKIANTEKEQEKLAQEIVTAEEKLAEMEAAS